MPAALDLKRMTTPEKLELMEALWKELSGNEENVPLEEWQKALLDARERQASEGRAAFIPWEEAKTRISRRIA